jgi:tripartite-type tricarboxylate transporter receptor subunit TctC
VAVIPDNKPGASAAIGTEYVAKAAPDGYTILMGYSAHATNPIFSPKLPYDTEKDFAAVVFVGYIPLILVTHPSFRAGSVKDLIALAKARPGEVQLLPAAPARVRTCPASCSNTCGGRPGSHTVQGNAPALNDVLGGQVSIMFDTITTALPHVRAGSSRPSPSRAPTLAAGAGTADHDRGWAAQFRYQRWYVVLAPAATPREIIQKLNSEINRAMKMRRSARRMSAQGVEFAGGTPEQADAFIRSEIKRWRQIIKTTGMSAN